jgi:hypothetical protein
LLRFAVVVVVVVVVVAMVGGFFVDEGRPGAAKRSAPAQVIEPAHDTYALGAAVTPHGAIPRDAVTSSFPRGGEVYLSINVAGASTHQEISVEWVSPKGEVIRQDEAAAPEGTAYVAFSSGSTRAWPPGEHRAVITINGRRVGERPFEVL